MSNCRYSISVGGTAGSRAVRSIQQDIELSLDFAERSELFSMLR